MTFARKVGLVAIAAAALTAMLGTASASAAETALCKNSQNAPYCESADRYPANTSFSAGFGSIAAVESPVVQVSCSESTITGTTSAATGEPLPVSISAWTLGGCKTGVGTKCTVTPVSSAPYSGTLNRTSGSNGTMGIGSGGKGKPGWTIKCGFVLNCTYTMEPGFTYTGEGSAAEMTASKVPLAKTGSLCPETSTFTGTYVVNSPQPAALAIPKSVPAEPATALCKSADNYYCESGDLYPSGTALLTGEAVKAVFKNAGGSALGDLTCKESAFTAKTTAGYGEPLPMNAGFSFANCSFANGMSCTVSPTVSKNGGIQRNNGDGVWSGLAVSFEERCGFVIQCKFSSVAENPTLTMLHGEPGSIELNEMKLTTSGSLCGESVALSGNFPRATLGPLMVTDAVR